MASHGTFIGICGYEYHGPKRHLGFAPKLTPENFRAPFTAAEGWGTFAQTISNQMMEASVEVQFGQLKLQTFHLTMDGVSQTVRVTAKLAGIEVPATIEVEAGRVKLTFTNGIIIQCGQKLSVKIA
jgi:non-lysosomal glucosylceramidase